MPARLALLLVLVSGCASSPSYCDIRSSSCRESIFFAVLDARGDPWDADSASPPSDVISTDQYRSMLEAQVGSEPAVSPWDGPLTVLDLLRESTSSQEAYIDDRVANVAAFYSGHTGRITVIDHGTPVDEAQDTFVLAHELVHAVQDRDNGLSAIGGGIQSSDQHFARESVIEGEAVLYSNLVRLEIEGRDAHGAAWSRYYDSMREGMDESVDKASARLVTALQSYVYPVGGRRLTDAYLAGGNLAVRQLWRDPPDATLPLLLPLGEAAPEPEGLTCPAPPSPPTATGSFQEQLGPIGLYTMAESRWMDRDAAWALARSWRDDTLWGFPGPSDGAGTVGVYRVRLADEQTAQQLATAAAAYASPHAWRVDRAGREVTIAASDDPTLLDTWTSWRCIVQ